MKYIRKSEEIILEAFASQAALCRKFGSPFTGQVLDCFAAIVDHDTEFGSAVLGWSGNPGALDDALPLRVSAAFHALARSGRNSDISGVYPPNRAPSDEVLKVALTSALNEEPTWLKSWLTFPPQTNEVGRSACLFLGIMTVAARFDLPLRIFEIGSSAGLNLNLDRYAYIFADESYGATAAPLRLSPTWNGNPPAGNTPRIVERRGCDLSPLDLSDPAQRERARAYFWPDQQPRIERADLAIEIARKHPLHVEQCEAAEWVQKHVALPEISGAATVLMHSLTWGYIPEFSRDSITRHMELLGDSAGAETPLAWVTFELGDGVQPALRLRIWPEDREELLAFADPHCWAINWQL